MLNLLARVNAAGADDSASNSGAARKAEDQEELEDLRAQVRALREAMAQEAEELEELRAKNIALEGSRTSSTPAAAAAAASHSAGGEDGWDLDFDDLENSPTLKPHEPDVCPAKPSEALHLRAALAASEEQLRVTQSELSSFKAGGSPEAAAMAASLKVVEQQLAEEQKKMSEALREIRLLQDEAASLRMNTQQVPSLPEAGNGDDGWGLDVDLDASSLNPEDTNKDPTGGGGMHGEQQGKGGSSSHARDNSSEELLRLRETVASLDEQLRAARAENSRQETKNTDKAPEDVADGWGDDLDMDVEPLCKAESQSHGDVEQLRQALASAEKQIASSQECTQSAEARLGASDVEVARLNEVGRGLSVALANTQEQMRAYQAEVVRMKGDEDKLAQAQSEAARMRGALEGTQGQMQAYQAEVIRLKAEESKVAHLQAEVTQLRGSMRSAEDRLGASQETVQRVKEADSALAQARIEVERLQGLSVSAEEKLRFAAAETAQSQSVIVHLRAELASAEQQASSKRQGQEEEAGRIAQDLKDARQRLLSEEQSCKRAQGEVEALKQELALAKKPLPAAVAGVAKDVGWDVDFNVDDQGDTATLGPSSKDSLESLRAELAVAVGRAVFAEGALAAEKAVNGEGVVPVLRRELDGLKAALLTERRAEPEASKPVDLSDLR